MTEFDTVIVDDSGDVHGQATLVTGNAGLPFIAYTTQSGEVEARTADCRGRMDHHHTAMRYRRARREPHFARPRQQSGAATAHRTRQCVHQSTDLRGAAGPVGTRSPVERAFGDIALCATKCAAVPNWSSALLYRR